MDEEGLDVPREAEQLPGQRLRVGRVRDRGGADEETVAPPAVVRPAPLRLRRLDLDHLALDPREQHHRVFVEDELDRVQPRAELGGGGEEADRGPQLACRTLECEESLNETVDVPVDKGRERQDCRGRHYLPHLSKRSKAAAPSLMLGSSYTSVCSKAS